MNTISIRNGKANLRVAMLVLTYAQYMREVDAIAGEVIEHSPDDYINRSHELLKLWNEAMLPRNFFTNFFQQLCMELNYSYGSLRQI